MELYKIYKSDESGYTAEEKYYKSYNNAFKAFEKIVSEEVKSYGSFLIDNNDFKKKIEEHMAYKETFKDTITLSDKYPVICYKHKSEGKEIITCEIFNYGFHEITKTYINIIKINTID